MKRISSKEIKKVLYGVILSDGYIDKHGRFDLYNKYESYIDLINIYLDQLTRTRYTKYRKFDPRFNVHGYRTITNGTRYFKKFREIFYQDDKKVLTKYICDRLDFQSLAHIWMCDGYLFHAKNKREDKIQNIGYFCLESFPRDQLDLFINRLKELGIESRLESVVWGYGYRPKISGKALQIFMDKIHHYITDEFKYKTILYYKSSKYLDSNLQSAEQYVQFYEHVEDIVRHS